MSSQSHKRIAKNTLMLYFRMLLTTGVSLYTLRVVLNALGVEDYGIYSVVAGIVALCSFLPGSMASATQRFFSFALGKNDHERLKAAFCVNWILYAVIAVIALLVLEGAGLWFVSGYLRIPPERFEIAVTLYHITVLTFVVGVFASPFTAIIMAHEDMHIYAYMSIGEALVRLLAVFLLTYLPADKLLLYGYLILAITSLNTFLYVAICLQKYEECQFRKLYWDRTLLHEVMGFTGWTLFGQLSTVARSQAVTVLLNQTFNPVVVAARAIAVSVAAQLNIFSANFNTGLYPPIIKSYAAGQRDEMFSLVFDGSKITFFLTWMVALPFLIEMDVILTLWLKQPPEDAVMFTRLAVLEALVSSVSLPLTTAARAPGKMGLYELVLGSIQLAIFAASWLVLHLGAPPYSVFVVAIVANLFMFFIRLVIVRGMVGISVIDFLRKVMVPISGVVMLSTISSLLFASLLPGGLLCALVAILFTGLLNLVCIYYLGLDRVWRNKARQLVMSKVLKLRRVA